MCQLLGMNANVPTDICFSFEGFRARGGRTDQHGDGWGIAFFEGRGLRTFLDPSPASHSPVADLVRNYPIKSCNVIAHIRRASQGAVALENCHPFHRELWGRHWVFAHNGNLEGFQPEGLDGFRPVGTTDSEAAFCQILQRIATEFGKEQPNSSQLRQLLVLESEKLSSHGPFNFLLSNGQWLFARCATSLHYIVRQAPFRHAHLLDEDVTIDFSRVTAPNDRVAIVATLPLTDEETWTAMEPGTLIAFEDGAPMIDVAT
jgi:glutamine amidotransferase